MLRLPKGFFIEKKQCHVAILYLWFKSKFHIVSRMGDGKVYTQGLASLPVHVAVNELSHMAMSSTETVYEYTVSGRARTFSIH